MRRRSWCAVLVSVAVVLVALPGCQPDAARGFPQHVRYAGGGLRVTSFTQAQQDQDVRRFYDHWKAEYLVKVGTRYRVAMAGRNTPATAEMRGKTTSESMGYGMMIVALMAGYDPNARTIFDGLWKFTKTNPSDIDSRLMGFLVPPEPDANNSAFDGDVDMAYGLLLADDQWGSTSGPINYRAQAKVVLAGAYASTVGPQSKLPELGDWVDSTGTGQYDQYTPRPSDFMPAHFRAFARITGNAGWNTVAAKTVSAVGSLQAHHAPVTGLLPDFTVPVSATDHTLRPAPPDFLEGPNDDAYSYNSMRVPWRLGTDALLNNSTTVRSQVTKMSSWIRTKTGGNPGNIKAGYELDGTVSAGADYFSTGFAAPFAVAAMTAPKTTANQAWLNALYARVRTTHEDYFEDSVTLLSLLVVTGNYWDPTV